MYSMNNYGIISQARMTSTRLPGKVLLKVLDKPLIQYHVERLQWSNLPIYIATTTNKTDDAIIDFCKELNISYYRGDEHNVLSRFYECALKNKLDVIVRVTSDCPLIDGKIIQEAVKQYMEWNNSTIYYSNCLKRTFPRGFDFEIFSFKALKEAVENATDQSELEHVTPYINTNRSGKIILKHFVYKKDESAYRLTVDTPEDFELIKELIENFNCEKKGTSEVIRLLKLNPHLTKINQHIEQKKS